MQLSGVLNQHARALCWIFKFASAEAKNLKNPAFFKVYLTGVSCADSQTWSNTLFWVKPYLWMSKTGIDAFTVRSCFRESGRKINWSESLNLLLRDTTENWDLSEVCLREQYSRIFEHLLIFDRSPLFSNTFKVAVVDTFLARVWHGKCLWAFVWLRASMFEIFKKKTGRHIAITCAG